MSEGFLIYLTLILIYLSDCLVWLNKGSVIFVRGYRKWRLKQSNSLFGTANGGIGFINILPPYGKVFCAHSVPIVISQTTIVSFNPGTPMSTERPVRGVLHFSIDNIKKVYFEERDLLINGDHFCKCGSAEQAVELSSLILELKSKSQKEREPVIRKFWNKQFDEKTAQKIVNVLKNENGILQALSIILFCVIFAVSPFLTLFLGLGLAIILTLLLMLFLAGMIVFLFLRKTRAEKSDRIAEAVKMLFCPPIAIRQLDKHTREKTSGYDPLVIAHILLSENDFKGLALNAYRCAKYPISIGNSEKKILDAFDYQRGIFLNMLDTYFQKTGLKINANSVPKKDNNSRQYCPRCHAQFSVNVGTCSDCAGVKTVSY